MAVMNFYLSKIDSPLGEILLVVDDQERVRALDYGSYKSRLQRLLRDHYGEYTLSERAAPAGISDALGRYFAGDLNALTDIHTATNGSALQTRVWEALRTIPAGRTTSYGDLAKQLGFEDPRAAIDIGAACGSNPIAIIDPCHRVISKDGGLRGYAGGVQRKRWLLEHEGAIKKEPEPATGSAQLPGM
jgi:methylated-DNA-[protein]-cysteine S-methyltransferase